MVEAKASLLALLMGQAEARGADVMTLRALAEEASERGAERALEALGLGSPEARRDMEELRELLQAWRDAKATAWKEIVGWIVRIGLAALVIGMAVKMGLWELVK